MSEPSAFRDMIVRQREINRRVDSGEFSGSTASPAKITSVTSPNGFVYDVATFMVIGRMARDADGESMEGRPWPGGCNE